MTDVRAAGLRPARPPLDPARYGSASPLHPVVSVIVDTLLLGGTLLTLSALTDGAGDGVGAWLLVELAVLAVIRVPLEFRRLRRAGGRAAVRAVRGALRTGALPEGVDDEVWARALWARRSSVGLSRVACPVCGSVTVVLLAVTALGQHRAAPAATATAVVVVVAAVALTAVGTWRAFRDLRRVDVLIRAGLDRTS